MRPSACVPVTEDSQVGEARRTAVAMAELLGFSEEECGKVALVVTEGARNVVKHAREGEVLLHPVGTERESGLEVLIVDRGPGILDVGRSMEDGYSTARTSGTGLGAMVRMSSAFELFTAPHKGTAILCQFWGGHGAPKASSVDVGGVCVPVKGEQVAGDAFVFDVNGARLRLMVVDGLGHGLRAHEAARAAVQTFHQHPELDADALLPRLHEALRSTRGAALAVAVAELDKNQLQYCGVGNISASLAGLKRVSLVSHGGTVGHELRRQQTFLYPWPADAVLVMSSDGLSSQWDLDEYPGLRRKHPSLIAGVLYRDFRRTRDDCTVVVARQRVRGGLAA